MKNPLELMMQQAALKTNQFAPNSRYYGIETATIASDHQGQIPYVKRRFIAAPENFQLLQEHTVSQGERPDHLAHQYLGDSEQFWRICDANVVRSPNELTDTIGKKIKITLPENIIGNNTHA